MVSQSFLKQLLPPTIMEGHVRTPSGVSSHFSTEKRSSKSKSKSKTRKNRRSKKPSMISDDFDFGQSFDPDAAMGPDDVLNY